MILPPAQAALLQAAHDDMTALQRQIAARQAFPESRRMLALDHALDRLTDGPRWVERAIGSMLGAGCALLWIGWRLGRR